MTYPSRRYLFSRRLSISKILLLTGGWTLADPPVVRRWRPPRRAAVAAVGPGRYQTPTFIPFSRTVPPVYRRALHRRTSPLRDRRREASLRQARRPARVRVSSVSHSALLPDISKSRPVRSGLSRLNAARPGAGEQSDISHEEEEAGRRSRRDWFRRAGQFSLSLSGSSEPPTAPTDSPSRASLSVEAEFFGAYLRNREASSSIRTADASCDSQPRSSCAASTDTEPDCGERGGEGGGGDTAVVPRPCPVVQRVEPQHGRTTAEDDINTLCPLYACSCEGACACAIAARSPSADAERKRDGVPLRPIGCRSIGALTNEQDGGEGQGKQEKKEDGDDGEDPEQSCCRSRSTIVRLLGARTGRLQRGSGGPTATTTTTSTRKFSVYPRDGHVGKVPRIGSTSSYEKLSGDEFEITRKTVLYASDPTSIDSGDQRRRVRRVRRYSSCDSDNLCEGVTVLDGLLVRRGVAVARGRKQSVTVMLFGTPAHGTFHRRTTDDDEDEGAVREMIRVSRLSLDAMPD